MKIDTLRQIKILFCFLYYSIFYEQKLILYFLFLKFKKIISIIFYYKLKYHNISVAYEKITSNNL